MLKKSAKHMKNTTSENTTKPKTQQQIQKHGNKLNKRQKNRKLGSTFVFSNLLLGFIGAFVVF